MKWIPWVGAALALTTGCVHREIPPRTAFPPDTSLAGAVVRFIADSNQFHVPVRLDPEPLPGGIDGPDAVPTADAMRSENGLRRVLDIHAVGLRSAPAPVRSACAGVLFPDLDGSAHRGCPTKARYQIVVLGHARAGGVLLPIANDSVRARELGNPAHFTVRALQANVTPGGTNAELADFVFARDGGRWVYVRRIPLLVVE